MSQMEASERFQGLCLIAMEGSKTIIKYDYQSPQVRAMIRNSSFNLCAACVQDMAYFSAHERGSNEPTDRDYKLAIEPWNK
jgi:hypothetical protein